MALLISFFRGAAFLPFKNKTEFTCCTKMTPCGLIFVCFLTLITRVDIVLSQDTAPRFQNCPSDKETGTSHGRAYADVYWIPPSVKPASESIINVEVVSSHEPGDLFYVGMSHVLYTLWVEFEEQDTCMFSVTVADNEAPVFENCPSDIITSISDPSHIYSHPVEWIEPTVSDNADAFPWTSVNYRPGISVSLGVWRVIYMARDNAGNEGNCTFVVYVKGGAIKGCPSDHIITTDPGSNVATAQWALPTVHLPSEDWQFLWTHEPGQQLAIGETRVVYSLLDPNGTETENCTFLIQVVDNEPPVITYCPDSITQPVDVGHDAARVTWNVPTTTDNTGDMVTLSSLDNPGDMFPLGVTMIEYTATDIYGNEQNCAFTITIEDTLSPTFVDCPTSMAFSPNDDEDSLAVVWSEPRATDNADEPNITSNYYSGDLFQSGQTIVMYRATDDAGNTAVCEFSVTVLGFPFNEFSRTGGFLLSGHDDVHLSDLSTFQCLLACVHETRFVCHSVDYNDIGACRLSSAKAGVDDAMLVINHSFDYYERLIDYTAPVITGCPRDIIRPSEPGRSYATIAWLSPSASDSSSVRLMSNYQPGESFPIGRTDVVYTAIDERNNTVSCSFTVTIQDLEYPELIDCPSDPITQLSNGPIDVEVSWTEPIATDNSDVVDIIRNHKPGDLFPPGISVVRYTAIDPSGNQVQCSFEVISKSLDNSHRLLLSMILLNFAFSDALHDRRTDQFKALSDALDHTINNVLKNDAIYQGAVTTGFRPDASGGVVADVSLAFSEELDADDRRQYLFTVLEAWEEDGFRVDIQEIFVTNQDGSNSTLDACLTLPCPSDMSCVSSGLVCSSYCNDNIGFCLNKGSCVRHEGHDLISCLCVDDNFHGRRCEQFELFNDSKVYAVTAAGIWFVAMVALAGIGLRISSQRKKNKLVETRKGSIHYSPKVPSNYAFHLETDGTILYEKASTNSGSTSNNPGSPFNGSMSASDGYTSGSSGHPNKSEEQNKKMGSVNSYKSDVIVPQREARQGSQPSKVNESKFNSPSDAGWHLPTESFELKPLDTNESVDKVDSQTDCQAGSVNSAFIYLDEVIDSGEKTLASGETTSLSDDAGVSNVEGNIQSQPLPNINLRTRFQNAISKARRCSEDGTEGEPRAENNEDGKQRSKKQKQRKFSSEPLLEYTADNVSNNNSSVFTVSSISADSNVMMLRKPAGIVEIHTTEDGTEEEPKAGKNDDGKLRSKTQKQRKKSSAPLLANTTDSASNNSSSLDSKVIMLETAEIHITKNT